MKIYTKTGDGGKTSLASGKRVTKTDSRLEAYGTADELNAFVGLLDCSIQEDEMHSQIEWIQNKLFNIGAALAEAEGEWITQADVEQLEQWIDTMQADMEPARGFVLPGGNEAVSMGHICRTITRRLERGIVGLMEDEEKEIKGMDELLRFVNRLSDFWYVFSQKCIKNERISYRLWKK